MVRRLMTVAHGDALQGPLALMLCEALLHVLVERRVIEKKHALEAIDSVAELVAELEQRTSRSAEARRRRIRLRQAAGIVEEIRASFAARR
jgi:hypothetical protein